FAITDVPPVGSNAFVYQSGTNGITGGTINFNTAYAGTNGLAALWVDSENRISQTAAGSRMVVSGFEVIGSTGSGTYTQSAGLHLLGPGASAFYLGLSAGSLGRYLLSGGTLNLGSAVEYVGFDGVGVIVQNGGLHIAPRVIVGWASSGTAILNSTYD